MGDAPWFLYAIGACIFLGLQMSLFKLPSVKNQSRFVSFFWQNLVLLIIAIMVFFDALLPASIHLLTISFFAGAIYTALALLQMYALKDIDTNALFPITTTLSLVFVVLIGMFLLNEQITMIKGVGILLVIGVVYGYLYKGKRLSYRKNVIFIIVGLIALSVPNKLIQKIAVDQFPFESYLIYSTLATLILAFLCTLYFHKNELKNAIIHKKTVLAGSSIGVIGFFTIYCILKALSLGPITLVSPIQSLYVLITACFSSIFYKEKLTKKIMFLIIVSIVAAILIRIG